MARMPAAEVDFTPTLVRTLLADQHPDLLPGREITTFANGWDNAMFRLGDDLLVRLPRRALAAELVEHEQAWLPRLVDRLPAAVPAPLRIGRPASGYPWSWSVLPWLHGSPLHDVAIGERATTARDLARFLAALHTPAPADVWRSPFRGGSLQDRSDAVVGRVRDHAGPAAAVLLEAWHAGLALPDAGDARLWVHGDVHPLNLLTAGGRLIAVIDWGDLTAGDPACDLAIAWLGFDAAAADAFRTIYDVEHTHGLDIDVLWSRARAWAVHIATMLLDSSDDHPQLADVGAHGLTRLAA